MSGRPRRIFSSVKFKWGLFWQVGEIFVHLNELHSELRIWQECPGSLRGLSGQRTIVVDQTGLKGLFYLRPEQWYNSRKRSHLIDFCKWDQFNIVSGPYHHSNRSADFLK